MSLGKKGQWFLISAVIISGSLLSISLIFKNYFLADSSDTAKLNEDYIMLDLQNQFAKIAAMGYDQPDCINLTRDMNEFIDFSKSKIYEHGRLVNITYSIDCAGEKTSIDISLASDRMSVAKHLTFSG